MTRSLRHISSLLLVLALSFASNPAHAAGGPSFAVPDSDNPIVRKFSLDLGRLSVGTPHEIPSIFHLLHYYNYQNHIAILVNKYAKYYSAKAKEAGDEEAVAVIQAYLVEHGYDKKKPGVLSKFTLWMYKNKYGLISGMVVLTYLLLALWILKNTTLRPNRIGAAGATLVEGFYKFICDVLGSEEEGRRYTPFLGTLFLFILALNYLSLVPFLASPSAMFFNNLGLTIAVFCYCQYIAFTRLGAKAYLSHLMGDPTDGPSTFFGIFPILPLEIMGEFVKPVSLSLRLFGNIMAEDILLCAFAGSMGVAMVMLIPVIGDVIPVGIPLHLLLAPLILLFSTIQALVFTFLSAVFISLKLPHGDHGEHGHH